MPFQPIVPTWLAWNNGNFTSPTALTDVRTGQPFAAGGLNLGDFFDATNQEAFQGSYTTNGTLFSGRYRFVQVDSGATAANVKTGTVGYLRNGTFVQSVVITGAGSGQTAGTYNVAANAGNGGTGALIQVVVGSAGTVTSATVLQGGYGYSSVPTFTLVTGGSVGTVAAQLNTTPNLVTSFDQVAAGTAIPVRPVVFLNSITPGNYGFIQELGTATVLGNATLTGTPAAGVLIQPKAGGAGTVDVPTVTTAVLNTSIGLAIDLPVAGQLFKIELQYVPVVQD
jgi:hypothetical protein